MRRQIISFLSLSLMISGIFCGCGNADASEDEAANTDETAAEEPAFDEEQADNQTQTDDQEHICSVTLITEVFGDGQKATAVAVEYDAEISADSLSAEAYEVAPAGDSEVDSYTVISVYTNSEADTAEQSAEGCYVIVEPSTDYTLSNYRADGKISSDDDEERSAGLSGEDLTEEGGFGRQGRQELSDEEVSDFSDKELKDFSDEDLQEASDGEDRPDFSAETTASNQLQVAVTQVGEIATAAGAAYAASEQYVTAVEENQNLIVDDFSQEVFTDSNGTELMYNLYLPEGYDASAAYPLVLFMPDATAVGSDPVKTLTQGLGAVIWADDAEQEKHACIVLAPQYESDNGEAATTMELVNAVCAQYGVDETRLYITGQSAGCIRAIQMLIDYPDTFAAAMLVAGQADEAYTDRLSELSGDNIWMLCAAGDERALPGMTAISEAVEQNAEVVTAQWSAKESAEAQNLTAEEMQTESAHIYWTVFDSGSVIPDGVEDNATTEHLNTWRVAYSIEAVRDWLFAQSLS